MLSRQTIPTILLFALLGGTSGVTTVAILSLRPDWHVSIAGMADIWPVSVVPGLMFGFIVGLALMQRGWLSSAGFAGFVAAATLCNFAAVTLSTRVLLELFDSAWLIGIVAGVFGSACLTACALALLPVARKPEPAILSVLAGGSLGALLGPAIATEGLFWWFVLYSLWQAGYAASVATALSGR